MTVINHYFVGRKTTTTVVSGVQDVRTIGDYLPMIVGGTCGLLAGAVTLVAMFSPVIY